MVEVIVATPGFRSIYGENVATIKKIPKKNSMVISPRPNGAKKGVRKIEKYTVERQMTAKNTASRLTRITSFNFHKYNFI